MACQSSADCNFKGFCRHNECRCDLGWFGENCLSNITEESSSAFTAYRVVFLLLFSLLLLAVVLRLCFKTRKESRIYGHHKFMIIIRGLRSPYNLLLILIILLCLSQIIWIAIDPINNGEAFDSTFQRFLYESAYIILLMMFSIILWVWFVIYEEIGEKDEKRRKTKLLYFRIGIICFILYSIGTLIASSVLKGVRTEEASWVVMGIYVVLFFVQIIFLGVFCFVGKRLYKKIKQREDYLDAQIRKAAMEAALAEENRKQELRTKYAQTHASTLPEPKIEEIEIMEIPRAKTEKLQITRKPLSHTDSIELPATKLSKTTSTMPITPLNRNEVYLSEQKMLKAIIEENENGIDLEEDVDHLALKLRGKLQRATTIGYPDMRQENKIKEMLKRNRVYLEEVEKADSRTDLATDIPIILSNVEGFVWDVSDEKECVNEDMEQKREKLQKEVNEIREKILNKPGGIKKSSEIELSNRKKKYLHDSEFIKNITEIHRSDKKVIKRISVLSTVAIAFSIGGAILNLKIYLSNTIKTPEGLMAFLWISRFLIVLAVLFLFLLFTIEHSQETENLRLIYKIGKSHNRINKLYAFVLPDYLEEEETKKKLEYNINYLTTGHSSFIKL